MNANADDSPIVTLEHHSTATLPSMRRASTSRRLAAANSDSRGVKPLAAVDLVPEHLLDGGEIVIFAIKPSLWLILFSSMRWLLILACVIALSPWLSTVIPGAQRAIIVKAALALAAARLGFAVMDWVARLYVLTNRRVMRIRGIFNVNLFECSLQRIQNTAMSLTWYERIFSLGSIHFATAGTTGYEATWQTVPNPMAVHEQIRAALNRSRGTTNTSGV